MNLTVGHRPLVPSGRFLITLIRLKLNLLTATRIILNYLDSVLERYGTYVSSRPILVSQTN